MSDPQDQSVIALLTNITRDTGQIKTDLAVNTTKTGYIEEHLRTLNGKVIKQEERLQAVEKSSEALINSKRRWDDGLTGFIKEVSLFALGLLSAYIINQYF